MKIQRSIKKRHEEDCKEGDHKEITKKKAEICKDEEQGRDSNTITTNLHENKLQRRTNTKRLRTNTKRFAVKHKDDEQ